MSFARDFWNYVVLDFLDRARGRDSRIAERSLNLARADLEVEYAAARQREPYLSYVALLEQWKQTFTTQLDAMTETMPHRRLVLSPKELPMPPMPTVGDAIEFQVCTRHFVEIWRWRDAQIEDALIDSSSS